MTTAVEPSRILSVEGLSARYGHVEALHPVDMHVEAGELVAVLGPNGAGKSTLMRALMGLVPTQGSVTFHGHAVPRRNPAKAAAMGLAERLRLMRMSLRQPTHLAHHSVDVRFSRADATYIVDMTSAAIKYYNERLR